MARYWCDQIYFEKKKQFELELNAQEKNKMKMSTKKKKQNANVIEKNKLRWIKNIYFPAEIYVFYLKIHAAFDRNLMSKARVRFPTIGHFG